MISYLIWIINSHPTIGIMLFKGKEKSKFHLMKSWYENPVDLNYYIII